MSKSSLSKLESDEFRFGLAYIATPTALYRTLRKNAEVQEVREAIANNELTEPVLRGVVDGLLANLRSGEPFKYDITLAALAVALEPQNTAFANEYISGLIKLAGPELAMSIRVARECLKNRQNVGESVSTSPKLATTPSETTPPLLTKHTR